MPEKKSLYELLNTFLLNCLGKVVKLSPDLREIHDPLILCYHSVGETGWRFTTPTEAFAAQISYLKKQYGIISLAEALAGKPGVVITFDDGYEDVFLNAAPILAKHNLTATVFLIGSPKDRNISEMQNSFPLMSHDQIKKLKSAGWTLGFHTQTHTNLIELNRTQLRTELLEGLHQLEKELKTKISFLAYPFGLYSTEVLKLLQRGPYTHAFTINGGTVSTAKKFEISRVGIEGTLTQLQFEGLISKPGLISYQVLMALLQIKAKLLTSIQGTKEAHAK